MKFYLQGSIFALIVQQMLVKAGNKLKTADSFLKFMQNIIYGACLEKLPQKTCILAHFSPFSREKMGKRSFFFSFLCYFHKFQLYSYQKNINLQCFDVKRRLQNFFTQKSAKKASFLRMYQKEI